MGLFSRKPKETARPDGALTFLTEAEAQQLRGLMREAFAERGLEVVVHPDHAVDAAGRRFGFWNAGAACHGQPRSTWPGLVREHVRRVLDDLDAPDPFQGLSPDDARRSTYARLYDLASLPTAEHHPYREFAPGLVEMLALDLPETVTVFPHEAVSAAGGWEPLHAAGVENLRRLPTEELVPVPVDGGGTFTILLGDSVHTGSRALLMPGLAADVAGETAGAHGWLLSVPNRHQVVWHMVRDMSVVGALNGMAGFAVRGYEDAVGPLSPHVYWWDGQHYEQLTQVHDGRIVIQPTERFLAVLEQLAAG
ncbi:hypothetical protein [Jannaschia sp. R86511]|uniref:hypothetical protein n=1 Tax=Jannaschia sp. R86511 TaxID=3093853 RepID=UPI0036D2A097